jgi:hypothetical protein
MVRAGGGKVKTMKVSALLLVLLSAPVAASGIADHIARFSACPAATRLPVAATSRRRRSPA